MTKDSYSQLFGILELHRPKSEPTVDIVAVHGLNGDAINTWTASGQKSSWLCNPELLPKYVPNARILTWGYNANITSTAGRSASFDTIMQHAHTLVAQLQADRDLEGASERPIIFLCHCLGGIIVKRALAYSKERSAPKVSHLQSIYTCTFAILFLGTPHLGSSKARLLGSLQELSSLTNPKKARQIEPGLLNALEEDSETLENITDQFSSLLPLFRIFFFWEQKKTDLKHTHDYVVAEESAAPLIPGTEKSGIAANHSGMCKFVNAQSPGFQTVVEALKRYSEEAPEIIKFRRHRAAVVISKQKLNDAAELLRPY